VRALETGTILRGFHSNGCGAVDGGTVREGFEDALREARDGEAILVTGSHYVAGELLKSLNFDV
jgi:folylpolyglutamate synthase/dihydropteroate synthase